jgi:tRNA pseudouridine(55) synthase
VVLKEGNFYYMLKDTVNIYKEVGETPLARLDRFREENPEYKGISLSYAGRLDPMAEGVLLVLVGDENKKSKKHLMEDKKYEVEILFGFSTDTFDTLGFLQEIREMNITEKDLGKILPHHRGSFSQEYPPYSSKTVHGKPLFSWAREGKIGDIILPRREVSIYDISFDQLFTFTTSQLAERIILPLKKVHGDFRQEKVISTWEKAISMLEHRTHTVLRISVNCSSGTYMRRLADTIGRSAHGVSLALSIKRTCVGDHLIADSIR